VHVTDAGWNLSSKPDMDTPLLVSVDTCVLLGLMAHEPPPWRFVRMARVVGVSFAVPPTAIYELFHQVDNHANTELQYHARRAVVAISGENLPDFFPADLTDEQLNLAKQAARRLRREHLLPAEEWNDTLIICESAVLGCDYLLTDDTHLLGVPQQRLAEVLRQMNLRVPRIISYASILT
jgi:hypothetical protein